MNEEKKEDLDLGNGIELEAMKQSTPLSHAYGEGKKMPGKPRWNDIKQIGSNHYKTGTVEPIDLIRAAGYLEGFVGGSIIKYAFRMGRVKRAKAIQDMEKVEHYARIMKAHLEGAE